MEFLIVINPGTRSAGALDDDNGFILTYPTYEQAKKEAEDWTNGISDTFAIYGLCTDERNHII